MKVIDRYIVARFLVGTVPVLLLLLILFSFLALADELENVGQGAYTAFDAFRVVAWTAPRRIVDLMPVTMLLGGLIGLGAMANNQELIAARAAGMSRHRIARPVLLMALAVAVAVVAAQSLLVPVAERAADAVRARTIMDVDHGAAGAGGKELWTRSHNWFVRVAEVRLGQLLAGLEVYVVDDAGRLQQLVQAGSATPRSGDDWLLSDVTITRLDGQVSSEERLPTLEWPDLLNREQADVLTLPLETLAPLDLVRLIAIQRANGLDTHRHRVVLWQQFSIPVALVGMALLSLPLLLGSVRVMSAGTRVVIGGFVGIAFYLLQQLTGHLAGLFALSPPLLIMAPAVALLAAAVYLQFLEAPRGRRRRANAAA